MNKIEKRILELLKELPELQVYRNMNDLRAVSVSPMNARDLKPERLEVIGAKLEEVFKLVSLLE